MKMRILLTGHNGYIGTVMVRMLLSAGHDVVGLDTNFFQECVLGSTELRIPEIRKDIRDVSLQDLNDFDAVIHLAAISNDPMGNLKPALTYEINCQATIRLAKLSYDAGISRFLYSSSCSIYGASATDDLLNEEAPLRPITPYAESKIKAEEGLCKMADAYFSPVFLRNATAYGFSPRLRGDIVLNNLAAWAYTTGQILIMSDGTPWRPIIHLEDISQAFLLCLTAPRDMIHNQAINIGIAEENYQVRELAEIVKETIPNSKVVYEGKNVSDPRNYRVDFTKLTRLLPEFQPKWNAHVGARQLYDAYRQHGLTFEDFQGRKYIRLNQVKHLLNTNCVDDQLRWKMPEKLLKCN